MNHNYALSPALLQAYLTSAAIHSSSTSLLFFYSFPPSIHPLFCTSCLSWLHLSSPPSHPLLSLPHFIKHPQQRTRLFLFPLILPLSLPCSLVLTLLNIPFKISPSVPRSSVSSLSIPLSRGEIEWVLMLVNYGCVEGTYRALSGGLTALFFSGITVNKGVRQRERRSSELV